MAAGVAACFGWMVFGWWQALAVAAIVVLTLAAGKSNQVFFSFISYLVLLHSAQSLLSFDKGNAFESQSLCTPPASVKK